MSNLEKYILENRDELDRIEAVPEEAIWQKIRANPMQQKPPAQLGFNWKMMSIAALVLALAGWGLLLLKKQTAAPSPKMEVPPIATPIAEQKATKEQIDLVVAEQKQTLPPTTQPPIAQAKKATLPSKRLAKKPKPTGPVITAEERQLRQLVALKQREIGLDTLNRATYADLLSELDELEISVEEARRDLADMPQRERLMETLIRYYELKIRILEQINYEINKQEYHETLEKRI